MSRRIRQFGCTVIVCIAACQSDEAPAESHKSSTAASTPATPGAAGGGAAPAMPSAANAPAAAGGGERPGSPGSAGASAAAGSAMTSSGSAGSSPDSKPGEQPAKDPSAAASCELPNRYTRATRTSLEVSWPETLVRTAGTGTLVAWAKVTYTTSSDGAIEMESHPCGSLTPVTSLSEFVGGLKAGGQVPFTAFDNPNMPTIHRTIMRREDRSLTFRAGTPLGTMLSDPDAEWPSLSKLVPFDHDGDGSPGVTVLLFEGSEYAANPTSISQLEFVDRIYVASRLRLQVSVTPACSGTAVGSIEPLGFDDAAVGCHVKDRGDCDDTELEFIRDGRINYKLGKSGTWTEVEVQEDASCADVRAALPPA